MSAAETTATHARATAAAEKRIFDEDQEGTVTKEGRRRWSLCEERRNYKKDGLRAYRKEILRNEWGEKALLWVTHTARNETTKTD